VAALVARYDAASAPLAGRAVGRIAADFTTAGADLAAGGSGESALGDLIADAQLAAAQKADSKPPVAAFMNPGGIRNNLVRGADGQVSYGAAFNVQPFGDLLVDMDLSGTQVMQMLEQQFAGKRPRLLEVSDGVSYTWSESAPEGQHVVAGSLRIAGKPLDPAATYRVEVNNFLAGGGDGFSVLTQGQNPYTGPSDIDALCAWLGAHPAAAPTLGARIRRVH
jgi:5'-nucleotidase